MPDSLVVSTGIVVKVFTPVTVSLDDTGWSCQPDQERDAGC